MTEESKRQTEEYIQKRLAFDAWLLLRRNLGRTPFYQSAGASYYLRDLTVGARLPWNRVFEVDLTVGTQIGKTAPQ